MILFFSPLLGLCLSPQYDAIAVICSKDDIIGPSYDELELNQHFAKRSSQLGSVDGVVSGEECFFLSVGWCV